MNSIKNIARVRNCPNVAISYSLFDLCLYLLSFCPFVFCLLSFVFLAIVSFCLSVLLSFCLCLFVFLSVCLFVFLSSCLFVFLSVCLFVLLSFYPFVFLSVCLFVLLSFCLLSFVFLAIVSFCLSVLLSFCLCLFVFVFFVCLSVCLFVFFLCLDIIEASSHSLCRGRVGSMAATVSPLLKHNGPLLSLESPMQKQGSLSWLDLDSFGWILIHGRNVPFWANQ